MICPNCGLANPDDARFCGNCGTTLTGASYTPPPASPPQMPYGPGPGTPRGTGRSIGQNIGIGCLIAFVIFFLFGLSCTRACFRSRRSYRYRRSGSLVRLVNEHQALAQSLAGICSVEKRLHSLSPAAELYPWLAAAEEK